MTPCKINKQRDLLAQAAKQKGELSGGFSSFPSPKKKTSYWLLKQERLRVPWAHFKNNNKQFELLA